jgi:putative restriction endonuclease
MKLWVGVTDKDWYEYLALQRPDEVNFWQPSGARTFKVLQPGEPFLFKLHSPDNFIVGGGFFVRYSALPASLAWDAFARKNGVESFEDLLKRVRKYRRADDALDPIIGCNVLAEPFFLPRSLWIPVPAGWAPNIVQGRGYESHGDGAALWQAVVEATRLGDRVESPTMLPEEDGPRFGAEFLTRARLGQGAFRVLVTDAYQRRCAVTGEKTLPVLEAAHIKPYACEGPHRVQNGLLLRSDLHKLFDLGYVTVTPEFDMEVSSKLREDWSNGREYYAWHGKKLTHLPVEQFLQPARDFLRWHNEHRFKS